MNYGLLIVSDYQRSTLMDATAVPSQSMAMEMPLRVKVVSW